MWASEKKQSVPSSHVTVSVKNQDAYCVYFRIKRDVELRTLMQAYSVKIGKEFSTLRFSFDGIRIKPNQTPNELELEDEEEIDVFTDQTGGIAIKSILTTFYKFGN